MRQWSPRATDREGGAATVWVLALASVIWFTAFAGLLVADVQALRHQAGAAADLAALAGARNAWHGAERACDAAGRVARANGGRLQACAVRAGVADVTVEVPLPARFGLLTAVDGVIMRARAGRWDPRVLD